MRRYGYLIAVAAIAMMACARAHAAGCTVDASRLIYPNPKKACLKEPVRLPATLRLHRDTKVADADVAKRATALFARFGVKVSPAGAGENGGGIYLEATPLRHPTVFRQEGYTIRVEEKPGLTIRIGAATHAGFVYALLTLEQMLGRNGVASVHAGTIEDFPSFAFRGVLEGGYSVWGHEQRRDIIRWMGPYKMNYFIYAPKEGYYFRRLWRKPFPPEELEKFKQYIADCRANDVVFAFSLSPALSMEYSSPEEFRRLVAKYRQIQALGVSHFGIFFDDVLPLLSTPRDHARYKNVAEAEADVSNRLLVALREKDPRARLFFVANQYWGVKPSKHLATLKEKLLPEIPIGWTGRFIVSDEITAADARGYGAAIGRKPSVGDNWSPLGPIERRAPDLASAADSFVNNPYNFATDGEAQLSKFVDATVGDYAWNPEAYNPERSLAMGCERIAGDAARGRLLLSVITKGKAGDLTEFNRNLGLLPGRVRGGEDVAAELAAAKHSLAELDKQAAALGGKLPGLDMGKQMEWHIGKFRERVQAGIKLIERIEAAPTTERAALAAELEKFTGVAR